MTALPGAGELPGIAGSLSGLDFEPLPLLEDEPPPLLPWSLNCWANGSLLANRLNEASCPSATVAVPEANEPVAGVGVVAGPAELWSVGAASEGVPAGVVVLTDTTGVGGG